MRGEKRTRWGDEKESRQLILRIVDTFIASEKVKENRSATSSGELKKRRESVTGVNNHATWGKGKGGTNESEREVGANSSGKEATASNERIAWDKPLRAYRRKERKKS